MLNYTSDDIHTRLVKEVISEAVSMLEDSIIISPRTNRKIIQPMGGRLTETIDFLKENFDITTVEDYIDE